MTVSGDPGGTLLVNTDGSAGSRDLQPAPRDSRGEPLIPGPKDSKSVPWNLIKSFFRYDIRLLVNRGENLVELG